MSESHYQPFIITFTPILSIFKSMKWAVIAVLGLFPQITTAQVNNMSAALLAEKSISWVRASYFKKDDNPDYQIFYAIDTAGRVAKSNTSDDILTYWKYPDTVTVIKTTVNPDIGNKIIEISKGWQTHYVMIYSADGDSIYHALYYDTVKTHLGKVIECFDIVYPRGDTTYRQLFSLEGNLLRYEIFNDRGDISAYYIYAYIAGRLDYTEYYEDDEFVYKEKITYYPDSDIRKQRVQVAGDDMFSNEETRNVTRYMLNEDGLLFQEVEFLGKEHVSTIGYSYEKELVKKEPEEEEE